VQLLGDEAGQRATVGLLSVHSCSKVKRCCCNTW
jgi:hypothetical protein